MLHVRRVATLIWKESLQIVRDPSSIFIAFVLPLALLLLFGYGVTLDLKNIHFGVALEDGGAPARALASVFEGSPSFAAQTDASRVRLMNELATGDLKGVLVIPNGFSSRLMKNEPADPPALQIVTDGIFPNTATLVQNYATSAVMSWLAQVSGARLPVSVNSRIWYNESFDSRYFIIPALIVVVMTLIGTMLTALVVAREWERGTMEAMLATPISKLELLLGKLIPYYILALMSTLFCVAFSTTFFGIPFRGSLLTLIAVGSVFMLCALAIGLMISNITKNQYAASIGALMVSFLPAIMLSGGVFELSSMPRFQQVVAAMLPAKYLSSCLLTLFLVGDVPELLVPNMARMALLGAIGLAATYRMTASRLG